MKRERETGKREWSYRFKIYINQLIFYFDFFFENLNQANVKMKLQIIKESTESRHI